MMARRQLSLLQVAIVVPAAASWAPARMIVAKKRMGKSASCTLLQGLGLELAKSVDEPSPQEQEGCHQSHTA